jgi:hypothetical protein
VIAAGKKLLDKLHDIFDGCPDKSGQRRGGLRGKWVTGRLATPGDPAANVRVGRGTQNTDTAALWPFRFLLSVWRGDDLPMHLMISLTETAPLGLVPPCSLDFQSQYLAPALREYVAELMGEEVGDKGQSAEVDNEGQSAKISLDSTWARFAEAYARAIPNGLGDDQKERGHGKRPGSPKDDR